MKFSESFPDEPKWRELLRVHGACPACAGDAAAGGGASGATDLLGRATRFGRGELYGDGMGRKKA